MLPYVITVTLPIYLSIALGYIAVRCGWIQPAEIKALGRYTVVIGVPALLFRGISHQTLGSVFNPDYLAVYVLGSFTAMAVVTLLARRVRGRSLSLAGLQGLGASSSNSMFIGYPIAVQVFGPAASVALALCMLVENIVVLPVGLALADADATGGRRSVMDVAAEAHRMGFVHEVVASDQLDSRVDAWVQALLQAGPDAVRACKRLLQTVAHKEIDAPLIQYTVAQIAEIRASAEGRAGVKAFLEKQTPAYRV